MSSHGLRCISSGLGLISSSHHVVFVGRMAALGSCKTNGQGGMSVIGWNHPGFGASSGSPDPRSEAEAIDAVLEFAQERLGYAIGEITLRAPQPTHPLHSCCRRRMSAPGPCQTVGRSADTQPAGRR